MMTVLIWLASTSLCPAQAGALSVEAVRLRTEIPAEVTPARTAALLDQTRECLASDSLKLADQYLCASVWLEPGLARMLEAEQRAELLGLFDHYLAGPRMGTADPAIREAFGSLGGLLK